MDFLQLFILAVVQGVTEFLPISSSGHLILVSSLTEWKDQGLLIDVALHIGTLLAVVVYFWRDNLAMLRGLGDCLRGTYTSSARLLVHVVAATLPVVFAGLLVFDLLAGEWRSAELIAVTTIVFGILLYAADRLGTQRLSMADMTIHHAVFIGLAQVIALVPGTSRSGITMTAARALGFQRQEAARFSLLLSIPTTFAAGALGTYKIIRAGDAGLQADALIAGCLAFVAALLAISGLMAWLRRASFTPFVVYRLLLGGFLLYWLYS